MKKGDAFCKNFKCRLKFLWGHQCDERDGLPASRKTDVDLRKKRKKDVEAPPVVGKTGGQAPTAEKGEKHPHAGGEDLFIGTPKGINVETPPRGWGRRPRFILARKVVGNTPTRVGKTP